MIIKVEQVEPGLHVFAVGVKFLHSPGEHFEGFDVAIGPALGKVGAPLLDFPRGTLMRSVFLDPFQHVAIAFAGGDKPELSRAPAGNEGTTTRLARCTIFRDNVMAENNNLTTPANSTTAEAPWGVGVELAGTYADLVQSNTIGATS